MFRRPSLTLAEVAWRWSFWAAGVFLLSALLIEYLDTLPVGPRDLFFLNSGQPTLIGRALSHIFQGSSVRLLVGGIVAVSGLSIAWTLIAALGRSASLGAIREYFSRASESSPSEVEERPTPHRRALGSLAGLNFLATDGWPCCLDWFGRCFRNSTIPFDAQESEASVGVLPHTRSVVVRLRRMARCELDAVVVCCLRCLRPKGFVWRTSRCNAFLARAGRRAMGNQFLVRTCASDAFLCWHHGCFNGAWDGSGVAWCARPYRAGIVSSALFRCRRLSSYRKDGGLVLFGG